jgi:hypothetical protein
MVMDSRHKERCNRDALLVIGDAKNSVQELTVNDQAMSGIKADGSTRVTENVHSFSHLSTRRGGEGVKVNHNKKTNSLNSSRQAYWYAILRANMPWKL